jgi:hypothetical protein
MVRRHQHLVRARAVRCIGHDDRDLEVVRPGCIRKNLTDMHRYSVHVPLVDIGAAASGRGRRVLARLERPNAWIAGAQRGRDRHGQSGCGRRVRSTGWGDDFHPTEVVLDPGDGTEDGHCVTGFRQIISRSRKSSKSSLAPLRHRRHRETHHLPVVGICPPRRSGYPEPVTWRRIRDSMNRLGIIGRPFQLSPAGSV